MQLERLYWGDTWGLQPQRDPVTGEDLGAKLEMRDPSLFAAYCLQCLSLVTIVVYRGPGGAQLVALPQTYGGLATPDTPASVAYYLDQAQRSQAMGAMSAAVAMYRAALEHLLHEQGYKSGMLNARITALMADQNSPEWRDRLGRDYLDVINRLGNAAIHANDGDVSQQAIFDESFLAEIRELFIELLDEVYEQPAKKAGRLARLQHAAHNIKRK
jgi:hypothetical protein